MPQGLATTLFAVIATAAWLLVARAVGLRRTPAAHLFVSVGVVIALWTTASLVQAQVDALHVRAVLLRFQLALGSIGPALWWVTLMRLAAPEPARVRSTSRSSPPPPWPSRWRSSRRPRGARG